MWKVAGDAARSTARFVRRHRRAIVVGGVVGAAACAYYRMKRALEEAEEAHQTVMLQANQEARYRQCLGRTRSECVAAVGNFLPTLKKRLFLAVDVTGPVRELKALRGAATAASAGSSAGSGGGRAAAADGSVVAGAGDVDTREVELWEQVKVTALTRLVVALYAFSALALMLHMQLHILGRLSLDESLELLRRASAADKQDGQEDDERPPGSQDQPTDRSMGSYPGEQSATALTMEARRALLSSTYEHVLGAGLKELVSDVERAVSRCTSSWQAHTRQEVDFKDVVAMVRRVRREVEDGGIGGTTGYMADDGYDGCSRQSSGASHALLLRYIINPSPDGVETHERAETSRPANFNSINNSTSTSSGHNVNGDHSTQQGVSTASGSAPLRGLGSVLNETWDTAESPTFAVALQGCLDATFGMVYEQLRQKASCRGTKTRSGHGSSGSPVNGAIEEGPGGGRAAASPDEQQAEGGAEATAVGAAPPGIAAEGRAEIAATMGERERFTQVLATVISQAKLIVSEILEPSPENEYAQAIAALPAVQDLCFSVFSCTRSCADTTTTNHNAVATTAATPPTMSAATATANDSSSGVTHSRLFADVLDRQQRAAAVIGRGGDSAASRGMADHNSTPSSSSAAAAAGDAGAVHGSGGDFDDEDCGGRAARQRAR